MILSFSPAVHVSPWPLALIITGGALLVWWLVTRVRRAVTNVKPLNTDRLLAIMYPEYVRHDHGWPNIETLMRKLTIAPIAKVPHIPAICRECKVMDYLPEDGQRESRVHWTGLCLDCLAKTPEGQALLAADHRGPEVAA
jgi:hypothetical protein